MNKENEDIIPSFTMCMTPEFIQSYVRHEISKLMKHPEERKTNVIPVGTAYDFEIVMRDYKPEWVTIIGTNWKPLVDRNPIILNETWRKTFMNHTYLISAVGITNRQGLEIFFTKRENTKSTIRVYSKENQLIND